MTDPDRPDQAAEHPTDGGEDLPSEEELEELVEDLEDVEGTVEDREDRRAIRETIAVLGRIAKRRAFGLDDVAQQVVGGFVLSGAFVVTEEVWNLAESMHWLQAAATVGIVLAIGYATLYRAEDRDPETEEEVVGIPLRFVSLMVVAYGSVALLALVFDAPATFEKSLATTVKAISIGAIFSVVGAATADSLF